MTGNTVHTCHNIKSQMEYLNNIYEPTFLMFIATYQEGTYCII
jgi:hypothetical protein